MFLRVHAWTPCCRFTVCRVVREFGTLNTGERLPESIERRGFDVRADPEQCGSTTVRKQQDSVLP